jgi:hypothetical protein
VEPSAYAEARLQLGTVLGESERANLRKLFLGLRGAKRLCKAVAGKVDFMCFGHDKSFATDFASHQWPYWINSNREDNRKVGWVELTFDSNTCTVKVCDPDGKELQQTKTNKR